MIERKFVKERVRGVLLEEYVGESLKNVGLSAVRMTRTPLGEKITLFASRPGLVVGRKGENIKKLTHVLKKHFELENPQIEIVEVQNPNMDARIVAERIASTLERFGSQKFKAVGHQTLQDVMAAGARGIEITISGKVPSARAKSWRFYAGYMKKSGQYALEGVKHATTYAILKAGAIGVKVSIMPQSGSLPDDISVGPAEVSPPAPAVEEKQKKPRAARKKEGAAPKKRRSKKAEKPEEQAAAQPKEQPEASNQPTQEAA
jgi:small subunit ribosomal protein S3